MNDQTKRAWVEVHMGRLERNYKAIRGLLAPGCKYLALVKAYAYGHGAVPVAKKYEELGADYFAVACLDEAEQLREGGIQAPILILGYTDPVFTERLVKGRFTQTVFDESAAKEYSCRAEKLGNTLRCHIKVDTGMGRLGFLCDEEELEYTVQRIAEIKALPGLNTEGLFMHFSSADSGEEEDEEYSKGQIERYKALCALLEQQGITFEIRHCAASAAIVRYPEAHFDMVRPGIIQYGCHTDDLTREKLKLEPVMEFKGRIVSVKSMPKGSSISYGRTHVLERDSRIAVVPMGYADGLFRTLSNRQEMLVRGKRVPQIGRVCMDMCMIDVTDLPDVSVGDEVTLFGDGLPVEEKAAAIGTISYELLCAPSIRVPRVYLDD